MRISNLLEVRHFDHLNRWLVISTLTSKCEASSCKAEADEKEKKDFLVGVDMFSLSDKKRLLSSAVTFFPTGSFPRRRVKTSKHDGDS